MRHSCRHLWPACTCRYRRRIVSEVGVGRLVGWWAGLELGVGAGAVLFWGVLGSRWRRGGGLFASSLRLHAGLCTHVFCIRLYRAKVCAWHVCCVLFRACHGLSWCTNAGRASWVWGRHWQHVWVVWARARCQGLLSCASRFEAPVVRYQIVAIWPSGTNYNLELQPPGAPGSNVMLGTTGARPPVASKVIQLIGWGSDGV